MIVRFPLERRIDHGRVIPINGELADVVILPVVRIEREGYEQQQRRTAKRQPREPE